MSQPNTSDEACSCRWSKWMDVIEERDPDCPRHGSPTELHHNHREDDCGGAEGNGKQCRPVMADGCAERPKLRAGRGLQDQRLVDGMMQPETSRCPGCAHPMALDLIRCGWKCHWCGTWIGLWIVEALR